MFNFISKAFYGAALNGAESGRVNPTQAHEITGMVRLALACGNFAGGIYILTERLRRSAYDSWRERYACKPDQDFSKAVEQLTLYVRRHA